MSKRRIPTDKQWFDYKSNKYAGWLFCFMSSSASFHEKIYYPKKRFIEDLPLIKKFLCVSDKRTITKYLKKLINQGYISEDNDNYYFPYVMNQGNYILIDRALLYNLCVTKSTITTQIFCYLTNRMNMKESQYTEKAYNFTLKELRVALGYSDKSYNELDRAIKECLQTLKAENYINYNNIYVDLIVNGIPKKVPNYQLTFITETIPQVLKEIKEDDHSIIIEISKDEKKEFIF